MVKNVHNISQVAQEPSSISFDNLKAVKRSHRDAPRDRQAWRGYPSLRSYSWRLPSKSGLRFLIVRANCLTSPRNSDSDAVSNWMLDPEDAWAAWKVTIAASTLQIWDPWLWICSCMVVLTSSAKRRWGLDDDSSAVAAPSYEFCDTSCDLNSLTCFLLHHKVDPRAGRSTCWIYDLLITFTAGISYDYMSRTDKVMDLLAAEHASRRCWQSWMLLGIPKLRHPVKSVSYQSASPSSSRGARRYSPLFLEQHRGQLDIEWPRTNSIATSTQTGTLNRAQRGLWILQELCDQLTPRHGFDVFNVAWN